MVDSYGKSEDQLQRKLYLPGGACVGNLPEGVRADYTEARKTKVDVVEGIEGFRAKLQPCPFFDGKFFKQRDIQIPGSIGCDDSSPRIAILAGIIRYKRRGVKPLVNRPLAARQVAVLDPIRAIGGNNQTGVGIT